MTLDGTGLPDGLYSVVVSARTPGGTEVVQSLPLTVSRTLGLVSIAPSAFSPNGDGRADRLAIGFMLNAPATVTVKVLREGRWVASLLQPTTFAAGPERVVWDGSRSDGTLADGTFSAVVEVTDEVGTVAFATPFVVDTTAPRAESATRAAPASRGQRAGDAQDLDQRSASVPRDPARACSRHPVGGAGPEGPRRRVGLGRKRQRPRGLAIRQRRG